MTKRLVKIGTRDSKLAMWQATAVRDKLLKLGVKSEIVPINSKGDLNRNTPLHQLGTVGVFTKALDDALLSEEVDIAVHSLKDVPTVPGSGLYQGAVLERDNPFDLFIGSKSPDLIIKNEAPSIIATGSIRRKAQWLKMFPNHKIVGIRGNVPTRISKIQEEEIDGTILSAAGLQRLNISVKHSFEINWMIPAPAQGVVGVFCRENDSELIKALDGLNHRQTFVTSKVERQVLNVLEGGCSAPIGAYATINGNQIKVRAGLFNASGSNSVVEEIVDHLENYEQLGEKIALDILSKGGKAIISELSHGN